MAKPLNRVPTDSRRRVVPAGHTVKYIHGVGFSGIDQQPRRVTACIVRDPTYGVVGVGRSVCSNSDTYIRKIGNYIALQRALKNMEKSGHVIS